MAIFPATLLLIVLLASGVLAFVALTHAAERGDDQTALSRRLRTVMAHLNGQAAPPPAIAALLAPASPRRATAHAVEPDAPAVTDPEPVVEEAVAAEQATEVAAAQPTAEQGTGRSELAA